MRALVVDDDEANRLITVYTLKKIGIIAQSVETLAIAKELLSGEWKPRVIFLDLFLKKEPDGSDGIDFIHYLKSDKKLADIPVIMVSASCKREAISSCLKAGASSYLIKPIQTTLLVALINNLGLALP